MNNISSRATGTINNGEVKINKIFSYDLVLEPAFGNAFDIVDIDKYLRELKIEERNKKLDQLLDE